MLPLIFSKHVLILFCCSLFCRKWKTQTRQNGTNECMIHYIELERMVSYNFFF